MSKPLIELRAVRRSYAVRRGLIGSPRKLLAVDGVSFALERGKTLGLVGESGSGKSTTGRLALGIEQPDDGQVHYDGQPMPPGGSPAWKRLRASMQMIYQDPLGALDRRMTILEQVREPLDVHRIGAPAARDAAARALLASVGLGAEHADRRAHELSGGQRQRAVLGRALVTDPELLVCDEAVSALDVSIQAQVVNLLLDLQAARHLAMLFISHDLKVVRHVSQQLAVMYLGQIVETGPTTQLLDRPAHPYTVALLSAVPSVERRRTARIVLKGDPPDPAARPTGCAFHPRCPVAQPVCRQIAPALRPAADGRSVACHFADADAPAIKEPAPCFA